MDSHHLPNIAYLRLLTQLQRELQTRARRKRSGMRAHSAAADAQQSEHQVAMLDEAAELTGRLLAALARLFDPV